MGTRRAFLVRSAALGGALMVRPLPGSAEPLNLPLGLQLYSVREQLTKDFEGTLVELGRLGYREVEAVGFYHKSAEAFRRSMTKAGLRCVSTHSPYPELQGGLDEFLALARAVGLEYLICSSPGRKSQGDGNAKLTLEDWRWNAAEFNRIGEVCKAAGIKFGYHNHVAEFTAIDGIVPYDELLRLTDPAKVTLEMDCGWVIAGGADPVALLRRYPGRFSMLHVKDFKSGSPETAVELGHGSIDYRPIFAQAARTQNIKHIFVEQEQFDSPYLDSLKIDADYLRSLT